jgi:hypothetical protein
LTCPPLGSNPDLSSHVLHVEVASQFCIRSNGFRFVADFLSLIDTMSGSNRLASGVVTDQRGHEKSLRQCWADTKLRGSRGNDLLDAA